MPERTLVPHPPFASLSAIVTGSGVTVSARDGLGIATVLVRKGQAAALAMRVKEGFGIDLPRVPRRAMSGKIAFAATGPEAWLAIAEDGGNGFAAFLRDAIGDYAAVVDQSDGYAVLRVSGQNARALLAKGVPLDLHARSFQVGDLAATVVSHIGTTIWRLADREDGAPVFELLVFRSLAESFWHWLNESAAEFGLTIVEVGQS